MIEYSCNECGRKFYTNDVRKTHQWLRHGEKKDWNEKLKYPAPTVREGAGEFERAWFELNQKRLLLEDVSYQHQDKAEIIEEELRLLEKLGNLNHQGRGKTKGSAATRQRGRKATGKTGRLPQRRRGGMAIATSKAIHEKVCPVGSKTRPPQPAGKPYWDSKHGRWSATKKGSEAARQQGKKAKATRPVDMEYEPVDDEPAGPD